MANYDLARPAPFGAITVFRVIDGVASMVYSVGEWNRSRKTRAMLSKLSDETLADIGLTRAGIDRF